MDAHELPRVVRLNEWWRRFFVPQLVTGSICPAQSLVL
jgi:hypothetical protein